MENLLSLLLTYALFGALGYFLSRRFKHGARTSTWILLGVAAVFSQWCFAFTRVVDIYPLVIRMNYALQAVFVGILTGLVNREIRPKAR